MTAPPARLDAARLRALADPALEAELRAFADAHGADALPALTALAAEGGALRRAARRALYRLGQRGIAPAPAPAAKSVVERRAARAARAWISGIDGSGSRALWVLFEGGVGDLVLCSLIVNDTVGVVDAAGGVMTKKRLAAELDALRASQKLPWIETEPARVCGLVAEALALHGAHGTTPPAAFGRWRPFFEGVAPAAPPALPPADPALAGRGAELLELPELAGWFLEPEHVQTDALALGEAHQSRLVVSDQIKAEREEAILARVVEREFTPEARRGWARRLAEMALVFAATDRAEAAAIAGAAAAALAADGADPARQALPRALARRALEVADEVAAGRLSAADVSRRPFVAGSASPARSEGGPAQAAGAPS